MTRPGSRRRIETRFSSLNLMSGLSIGFIRCNGGAITLSCASFCKACIRRTGLILRARTYSKSESGSPPLATCPASTLAAVTASCTAMLIPTTSIGDFACAACANGQQSRHHSRKSATHNHNVATNIRHSRPPSRNLLTNSIVRV